MTGAKDSSDDTRERIGRIYLTLLSRNPTVEEIATIESYAETTSIGGAPLAADIVWVILNQPEFLYNH